MSFNGIFTWENIILFFVKVFKKLGSFFKNYARNDKNIKRCGMFRVYMWSVAFSCYCIYLIATKILTKKKVQRGLGWVDIPTILVSKKV